jgi:hypothetical protein
MQEAGGKLQGKQYKLLVEKRIRLWMPVRLLFESLYYACVLPKFSYFARQLCHLNQLNQTSEQLAYDNIDAMLIASG